jgi:SSS family solute:Na+ symporter
LGQIFTVAIEDHKFAFAEWTDGHAEPVSWALSLKDTTITMMLIIGLTVWLNEYSANQNTVQRYCASKNVKEARKAMFVCAFTSVPIWAFYMFLGTSLYVFFKIYPTVEAAEMLSGARKADQVLPFFIVNYMPPGITGLVIAAVIAAGMSSLDSSINAISTVTVVDLYRRHLAKNKSDKHYLKVAWATAAFAAVLMIAGAIVLARSETKTFQDTAVILGSLFGGGLLGLYLLGFFTKKGDARSVGFGIVFTIAFTTWTILSDRQLLPEAFCFPFNLYYAGIGGNFVMFVTGYIVGTILPGRKRNLKNLTVWEQTKLPLE